jgi:hypothetical protein
MVDVIFATATTKKWMNSDGLRGVGLRNRQYFMANGVGFPKTDTS